ncbi:MAG TPA: undecaprenyl-diphosphate phosphatase [Acidimicrobiia bacterium]|nr:undecaprenyl-diphosphate phosphatase [Acidimicrobiia bacterium]
MSYFQAIIIGLLQGVTELFPISSLGHSVIVPGLLGWHSIVNSESAKEGFYLAFLVGLHVATALALLWFFRADWVRIIGGFFRTLRTRRIETSDERLAWLLVVATIPAGIMGLIFEHSLRTVLATPVAASALLTVNGLILVAGERARRRQEVHALAVARGTNEEGARRLETMDFKESGIIGVSQVFALAAGISRSGITMVAGLVRGLDHEDAARFSFLLATPIILAAGVYKIPDLAGANGNHVRGQILVGSICAAVTAYLAVRFLMRYFETRTLTPFAIYCLVVGISTTIYFAITWP